MEENTFNDYTPFAALSVGQAKELFRALMKQEYERASTPEDKPIRDVMGIGDALGFLDDNGCPLTIKTLYGLVAKRAIPHRHIGKRLVFSKKELLQWIESRTTRPETKADAAKRIAESANYKN